MSIVNPKHILDIGAVKPFEGFPAIIIDPNDPECALQQNGIDLRLAEAYVAVGSTRFTLGKRNDQRCQYERMFVFDNCLVFEPGHQYALDFMEWVEVPIGTAADIYLRSSTNRYAGVFTTGLWDSGFRGRLGGIFRPTVLTTIEVGVRVAQIVFFEANSHRPYSGQYQDQIKQV